MATTALVAVAGFVPGGSATAQNVQWVGSDGGLWDEPTNWDSANVPTTNEDALATHSNATPQTIVYQNAANPSLNSVTIDGTGGAAMTVSHTGGDTLTTTTLTIADTGIGGYDLRDGAVAIGGNLIIGNLIGSAGTFNYNTKAGDAATMSVTGTAFIGASGKGTFNQGDGALTVGAMVLGQNGSGSGTYNLNGGTLNDSLIVGDAGVGVFNNSGGTHNVFGDLIIGNQSGGDGTYNLSGTGSLAMSGDMNLGFASGATGAFNQSAGSIDIVSNENIGLGGKGTFTQTGGSHGLSGDLAIGFSSGSQGKYDMSGAGSSLSVTGTAFVGAAGKGDFVHNGGSVGANVVSIGNNPGGIGTYTLKDGTLTVTRTTFVGASGDGTFTQSGGTHTAGNLSIANDAGGVGTYNLSGGNLTISDTTFIASGEVGSAATGTFNQSGGTHSAANVVVGNGAIGTGTYNLKDGTLTIAQDLIVGNAGKGIFNQSGGTHNVAGTLTIAKLAGSLGTYDLSGGTLTAAGVVNNDTFNYSGGSLTGNVANNASMTLSGAGTRTIAGDVTNSATGTFKVSSTTAQYSGTFTNQGAYISDPSLNQFNNLTIDPTGYLVGGTGDIFEIAGDFLNGSQQNLLWDTDLAELVFDGGAHQWTLAGLDLGAVLAGYNDNFSFFDVFVDLDATLNLGDGNGANASTAFYTRLFSLENQDLSLFSAIFSPFNIYYDASRSGNAYLQCRSFDLNGGGKLIAIGECGPAGGEVPEPGTLMMFGAGLAGLLWLNRRRPILVVARRKR
jgi:T5SS/PEP-CTERM-associated repeat protein